MRKLPKTGALRVLQRNAKLAELSVEKRIPADEIFDFSFSRYQINRRKFLIGSAKASLALTSFGALSSFKRKPRSPASSISKNQEKRIAIIGGGMAGLSCAYSLLKAGYRSTIYEARNRTGGRMLTKKNFVSPNITTDLGGEFVDSIHKDMFKLTRDFDLSLIDTRADTAIRDTYFVEGQRYSDADIVQEFSRINHIIRKDNRRCGKNYASAYAKELDQLSLEAYLENLDCEHWLKLMLREAYDAEMGIESDQQSALNLISFIGTSRKHFDIFGDSDERYKIRGGSSTLTDTMTDYLESSKIEIRKGMPLETIESDGDQYRLSFQNTPGVTADYVVLAIPFTTLREIDLQLDEMTSSKKQCISNFKYGQNNKLLLGLRDRPWRNLPQPEAGFLFNEVIQNGWDHSQMQNSGGSGGYTVYLGGTPSIDLAQNYDESGNQIANNYIKKLDEIYPGAHNSFTSHKAALWSNEPYSQGSYAAYGIGQWTSGELDAVAEPVGNVFFAGEHCSQDFQGYMNGAAETGRIAAESILAKI